MNRNSYCKAKYKHINQYFIDITKCIHMCIELKCDIIIVIRKFCN